jgi:hypothetical protein
MIKRCTGLPVVIEHPPSGQLDGTSFAERVVGVVTLPYPRNGELWGVAKIYDDAANAVLESGDCSTSPSMTFAPGDGGQVLDLGDGKRLNIEGTPARVDHLALVPDAGGVWDRGQPGRGVRADSSKSNLGGNRVSDDMMADAAPPDAVMTALNKLTDCLTGMAAKQDAMSGRLDKMASRMDAMEAAAQPAQGDMPAAARQVAADGASQANPNGTGPEATRYEEDRRRGAAIARLAEESLEKEREATRQRVEAQVRADQACVAFGERAPLPMQGETPLAYRKRLLRPYRRYSPDYEKIDVDAVNDAAMFAVIEQRVFADAIKAAENCEHLADDGPHPVERSWDGHKIVEWRGRRTFIAGMKPPLRRAKLLPVRHTYNEPG